MKFRNLRSDEIDIRVQSTAKNGNSALFLLYKDSRADMNILDETVGAENWQRKHTNGNHNCIVSIWDENKNQWIEKEDTGSESMSDKDKGLASDSFKRACVNWGIGRELYSLKAVQIRIQLNQDEVSEYNGKWSVKSWIKFYVSKIEYVENEKRVRSLEIVDGKGNVRFSWYHKSVPVREITQTDFQKPPAEEHPKQYYLERLKKGYDTGNLNAVVYENYKTFTPNSKQDADDLLKDAVKEMKINETTSG